MTNRSLIFLLILVSLPGGLDSFRSDFGQDTSSLPEEGIVTVVYDGDTIQVRRRNRYSVKVRLLGVDALELSDSREDVQLRAEMAKRFCFIHLYREEIKLTYDWQKRDSYGRLLAYVWTGEHGLFNRFIIGRGFATTYRRFPFKFMDSFVAAEDRARQKQAGLWAGGDHPLVSPSNAGEYEGSIISVRFRCRESRASSGFHFLEGRVISCLIPLNLLDRFQDPAVFKGRMLQVYGLVEKYRGEPQILVYYPSQLSVLD